MRDTIIFYYSYHHKNTKKLIENAVRGLEIDVVEIPNEKIEIENYRNIGFASGIYNGEIGKPIYDMIKNTESLNGKNCFTIYTCGSGNKKYSKNIEREIEERGGKFIEGISCKGFDTYGIFKIIGGISKNHPNENDIEKISNFLKKIVDK